MSFTDPNAKHLLHKVSPKLYEFEDWAGVKYEAVRGEEDGSWEAKEAARGQASYDQYLQYAEKGVNMSPTAETPSTGYRWWIYQGDECLGSYISPLKAAQIFQLKNVSADGLLS